MATIIDEALVIRVEDRNSADKYVTCFSRFHGRVRFSAFGAKYYKSSVGPILQYLSRLQLELEPGKISDKLLGAELLAPPPVLDFKQLAYASVMTEVTEDFTADHESDTLVYGYLLDALTLLTRKNPRVVVLAFCIKLLHATGFGPDLEKLAMPDGAKELYLAMLHLDFARPGELEIRGSDLKQLEHMVLELIYYQINKPLKSLVYLRQLGI